MTFVVCVTLVACLFASGTLQLSPRSALALLGFAHQRAPAGVGATDHAGSSGPPPQGVVAGDHTITVSAVHKSEAVNCNVFGRAHAGLSSATLSQLRKLAQYEQLCDGAIAERSSFFVITPSTAAQAQSSAQTVVSILQAYARYSIKPLVFMEPVDLNGQQLDLKQYASGAYDAAITAYFAALQAAGITAGDLGMWVYLPEGNLPQWSTTDPAIYAAVVTKMATLQKQYFPGSQSSLLLDSESYAAGATWGAGKFVSLAPYVETIPKGLFDSFGLQGFPWAAPASDPNNISYNPSVYLRTDFAVEAAHLLGTTSIWVNTGTFASMYANKPGQTVSLAAAERQAMLSGVVRLMIDVKAKGFSAAIHLFAEDKSATAEATDWSYWHARPNDTASTSTLITFLHDAHSAGIHLWLYDNE